MLSRRELAKYGAAAALLGLAPLGATLDGRTASADNPRLIDFAERRIAPDRDRRGRLRRGGELRVRVAAGRELRGEAPHPGVRRRVTRRGITHRQQLPVRQAKRNRTLGLHPRVRRWRGRRAHRLQAPNAAGGSNSAPIFFSVDDDINVDTWNGLAVNWFRGINSVLGTARTGIYGHFQACRWATNDGVIGQSTTAGHRWAWQTKSWSHGQRDSTAVLYQEVVNTPSNPGPLLGGINIDVDEVLAPDSASGISAGDLVRAGGGFYEIRSTGSAFVGRYHFCGNLASPIEVFRYDNPPQSGGQRF